MMIDLRSGYALVMTLCLIQLRSDDEMLVKPNPKRKLKRKRHQQKLKPTFKKLKQEKPARKKSPVKKPKPSTIDSFLKLKKPCSKQQGD